MSEHGFGKIFRGNIGGPSWLLVVLLLETAWITGASSGIGFELARALPPTVPESIDLVLVARNLEHLRHTAETLEPSYRIRITTVAADLSRPEAPDEIRDAAESHEIAVHYLVNNAGVGVRGSFQDPRLEDKLAMMRLNMDAMVGFTKLFLPGMLRQKSGRILNLASLAGCQPGVRFYYATKSFVLSFSRELNEEFRGTGVSVTALCPGPVDTHFHETGELCFTAGF